MFNEGVDVPEIDTVLMLRPTEFAIVWMQQFGRGLRRRSTEKSHLVVVDYIGNHRIFLSKVRSMLGATEGDRALASKLEAVRKKEIEFPPGCEVTYELRALEILEGLLRVNEGCGRLRGVLCRLRCAMAQGQPLPKYSMLVSIQKRLVMEDGSPSCVIWKILDELQKGVEQRHGAFLQSVSATPMSKSYKMLVLDALLAAEDLTQGMRADPFLLKMSSDLLLAIHDLQSIYPCP